MLTVWMPIRVNWYKGLGKFSWNPSSVHVDKINKNSAIAAFFPSVNLVFVYVYFLNKP